MYDRNSAGDFAGRGLFPEIEGRMKRPEYTAGVVRIYRKYLDRFLEYGEEGYRVEKEDYAQLQNLYNRGGFSRGYYQTHNGKELMSLSYSGHFDEKSKDASRKKRSTRLCLISSGKNILRRIKKEKIQGIFRISTKFPMEFVVQYKETQVRVTGEDGL